MPLLGPSQGRAFLHAAATVPAALRPTACPVPCRPGNGRLEIALFGRAVSSHFLKGIQKAEHFAGYSVQLLGASVKAAALESSFTCKFFYQ